LGPERREKKRTVLIFIGGKADQVLAGGLVGWCGAKGFAVLEEDEKPQNMKEGRKTREVSVVFSLHALHRYDMLWDCRIPTPMVKEMTNY
jgi:hypothetical protein